MGHGASRLGRENQFAACLPLAAFRFHGGACWVRMPVRPGFGPGGPVGSISVRRNRPRYLRKSGGNLMGTSDLPSPSDVTRILGEVSRGERNASSRLLPLVYEELRRLAQARMAGLPPGQTLQPTALVHDAYLRLIGDQEVTWNDRAHFFGAAATAMRDILVERARRRARIKHGGEMRRVELGENLASSGDPDSVDLLALNDALNRLEAEAPRKSQIVMLRYFAGLSIDQTASALNLSPATVSRDWDFARAWLVDAMSGK